MTALFSIICFYSLPAGRQDSRFGSEGDACWGIKSVKTNN